MYGKVPFMDDKSQKSLFITIVGEPNVGKSSVLNMIVGEKISIVSPKPQTTRNKIIGIFTENCTQLVFTDTPGVLKPKTRLGDFMLSEITNSFLGTGLVVHVVEACEKISDKNLKLIEKFKIMHLPAVLAINKIDTLKDKVDLVNCIKHYSETYDYHAIVPVSAIKSDGRRELIDELQKLAKPSVFFYDKDEITDQPLKVIVSEIIREKMLYLLNQELPHGVAVFVENFHQRESLNPTKPDIIDISALIKCERRSHKPIIIGRNGEMIKKIGMLARVELEKILNCKINLKLWVKVKENWRNDSNFLGNMGYVLENN